MSHYISIKHKLLETFRNKILEYQGLLELPPAKRKAILEAYYTNRISGIENPEGILYRQATDFSTAYGIVNDSKTIIFSTRQAEVFDEIATRHIDILDYKLPFPDLILQFDVPLLAKYPMQRNTGVSAHISGLLLRQITMTQEQIEMEIAHYREDIESLAISDGELEIQPFHPNAKGEIVQNVVCIVFSDGYLLRFAWESGVTDEKAMLPDLFAERANVERIHYRNLAVACIGYINCENVYLERESVPERINEKRERKGKSRLEPYYICRIRGVQYDSTDPTGTGAKHGIRYDVRGHFRRLQTGKTTWIRPHQRGLQNELYVPKTYLVDKVRI